MSDTSQLEPFVQRDRFTILNTETEAEAKLRGGIRALTRKVNFLETALIGVVELLHEHGIDAPEFDPDDSLISREDQ